MAIVTQSGLIVAVNAVAAYFAANSITATVALGWRQRDRQDNQGPGGANRVVFIPSGGDDGAAGELGPVEKPGDRYVRASAGAQPAGTIRPLATWTREVLVSVWATDNANPRDEGAQIQACETLLEQTVRAVHTAPGAFAEARWGKVLFTPPGERSYGLEALVGLTFQQPIFDVPRDLVYPSKPAVARTQYTPPVIPTNGGDT